MLRFKSFNDWWFSGACRKFDGILLDIDGTLLSGRKKRCPALWSLYPPCGKPDSGSAF